MATEKVSPAGYGPTGPVESSWGWESRAFKQPSTVDSDTLLWASTGSEPLNADMLVWPECCVLPADSFLPTRIIWFIVCDLEWCEQLCKYTGSISNKFKKTAHDAKGIIPAVFLYFKSYLCWKLECWHAKHFCTTSTMDFLSGIFL